MSKPIAPAIGIAFAFPDVCKTPAPPSPSPIPIPYPNIAQLSDANPVTDDLVVGPSEYKVLLKGEEAEISTSSGDEAGSAGGVSSGVIKDACKIQQSSESVVYGPNEYKIVRFMDATTQNKDNASGFVMSAFPTVLVGD